MLRSTFVNGTDVYLPTDPPAFIELDFNGAKLRVPNWPSKTVVFRWSGSTERGLEELCSDAARER